mmetsp:Transcript_29324/g.45598  ORF Transcript_29324/g.45598 Transcript_29324/m.45598 type:complete len:417 (-) Transcript_29324:162-1412(-)|eukprot:CAMPEP_0196806736 /NCGR_PEP_ID=MMETSP1362-20130617/6651_1 /TAXON_ID=163516 /ORGANISM="Leptocylindrus danicus, Strain CCMP1856" /LENGTH=416 /DNA_ID=CAMNT_0042180349 /DNA_START=154 /DNA_END=1404 /DNA_ORIENTATION=-
MYRPSRRQSSAESLPSYGGSSSSNYLQTPQSVYTPPPAPNNSSPYTTHPVQYGQRGGNPSPPNSHSQAHLRPVYPMSNGSPYQQMSAKTKTSAGGICKYFGYLILVVIVASGWVVAYQLNEAKTQATADLSELRQHSEEMSKTLGKVQEESSFKSRDLSRLESKYKKQMLEMEETYKGDLARLSSVEQREEALMDDSARLREFIQMQSRLDALEKFGEGPYRIYVEMGFHEDEQRIDEWRANNPDALIMPDDVRVGPYKFIIKLAPLDLMPHSVHMFLQMVSLNLYEGIRFNLNPGHVIMTASSLEQKEAFDDSGYSHLSFSEHHPEYPHKRHTIGFASRPPGPHFYINMRDNEDVHGPGGQSQYVLNEEADPCFGEIIAGFDAIDRIKKLPLDEDGERILDPPIFRKVKMLKPGE